MQGYEYRVLRRLERAKALLTRCLMCEPYNPHDSNSVLLTVKDGSTVLGHLEKHITGVVAPLHIQWRRNHCSGHSYPTSCHYLSIFAILALFWLIPEQARVKNTLELNDGNSVHFWAAGRRPYIVFTFTDDVYIYIYIYIYIYVNNMADAKSVRNLSAIFR